MIKYSGAVPLPVSIAVNFLLGWAASFGLMLAMFIGAGTALIYAAAAVALCCLINLLMCLFCTAVRDTDKIQQRRSVLRAAAAAGTFIFMTGSPIWADTLWSALSGGLF